MPDGLLEIVKNRLDITWLDEATQSKLTLSIKNGISFLDSKSGVENDYTTEGSAQTLLFMYVMYDWSNALDDFYINYRSEIIAFINKAKADKYASQNE